MLVTLADRLVTLRRSTAQVLDPTTAAASLTVSRQPVREGCLRVTVAGGTTGSGTVTVTGAVGGVAGVSEVLTFTANGSQTTTKRFTAISSIATSGLSNEATVPTVTIQSVGGDGTPQRQDYDVATGIPMRPVNDAGRWPGGAPGAERSGYSRWRIEDWEIWTVRVGDKLIDESTSEEWLVEEVSTVGERDRFFSVRTSRV